MINVQTYPIHFGKAEHNRNRSACVDGGYKTLRRAVSKEGERFRPAVARDTVQ